MHAWSVTLAWNKTLKPISICGSSSSGIHCNVATTMGTNGLLPVLLVRKCLMLSYYVCNVLCFSRNKKEKGKCVLFHVLV